jgi:hypothetical protein
MDIVNSAVINTYIAVGGASFLQLPISQWTDSSPR